MRIQFFLILICLEMPSVSYAKITPDSIDQLILQAMDARDAADFQQARRLAETAIELAGQMPQPYLKGIADGYVQIGRAYKDELKYDPALENYEKALQIRILIKDIAGIASIHNNLSSIYSEAKLYGTARKNSDTAVAIYSSLPGKKLELARSYNNLANALQGLMKLDLSIESNLKSIALLDPSDTSHWATLIDAEYGLAKRNIELGRYEDARQHLHKMMELAQKNGDPQDIAEVYETLGVVELRSDHLNESLNYLNECIKICIRDSIDAPDLMSNIYLNLGEIYASMSKFEMSIDAYTKVRNYLHEGEYNEIDEEMLQKRLILTEEMQKNYYIRNTLFIVLISALAFVVFLLYRLVRARAEKMVEKEERLRIQEEALVTKKELLDTKEKLQLTRHSIIQDSLESLLPYIETALRLPASETFQENFLRFRRMVQRLLRKLDEPLETIGRPLKLLAFAKEMHQCAEDSAYMKVNHESTLDDAGSYPLSPVVAYQLEIIINLAFTNIRKHAACKKSTLAFDVVGNALLLEISDDGVGFDPDMETDRQGVKDIRLRVDKLHGTCLFDSAPGQGCRIQIKIPSFMPPES